MSFIYKNYDLNYTDPITKTSLDLETVSNFISLSESFTTESLKKINSIKKILKKDLLKLNNHRTQTLISFFFKDENLQLPKEIQVIKNEIKSEVNNLISQRLVKLEGLTNELGAIISLKNRMKRIQAQMTHQIQNKNQIGSTYLEKDLFSSKNFRIKSMDIEVYYLILKFKMNMINLHINQFDEDTKELKVALSSLPIIFKSNKKLAQNIKDIEREIGNLDKRISLDKKLDDMFIKEAKKTKRKLKSILAFKKVQLEASPQSIGRVCQAILNFIRFPNSNHRKADLNQVVKNELGLLHYHTWHPED